MMGWVPVCRLADVVKDELLSVQVCNDNLIVCKASDGSIRIASAHCPHVGTHLGKNSTFSGGVVTCPLHSFRYNFEDGSCLNHKNLRLRFFRTQTRDDLVWVQKEADFVELQQMDLGEAAPPSAPQGAAMYSCSWILKGASYRSLTPHFSRGGDLEDGLVAESPLRAFSHLKIHAAPIDDCQIRVFVVAFLAEGIGFARKLSFLERYAPGRQAFELSLRTLLEGQVLLALGKLSERPDQPGRDDLGLSHSDAGESRYQPIRSFLNDWMFVAFVRDVGVEPKIVERMGRHVNVQRQADGSIQVTSADGGYRYESKIDPHYGVILAYFSADFSPPPWTIPDFEFDQDYEIYDSYTNTTRCAVEDIHGTVLDWTHLTGFHRYAKSSLINKTVGDYSIGATYVTQGREFARHWRLGNADNINRLTIHGLCCLDFHYQGHLTKDVYFEFKLLSLFYISEQMNHELIIASFKRNIVNMDPLLGGLMYAPLKKFTFATARSDLITEAKAIYDHKRILRKPEGVSTFPYLSFYQYAEKFYPEVEAKS
jgi:nitrite reductase/ring-hydroxylating ferredoxin subunit